MPLSMAQAVMRSLAVNAAKGQRLWLLLDVALVASGREPREKPAGEAA